MFYYVDLIYFKINIFKKNLSGIPLEYKRVWTQNAGPAKGINCFQGLSADNTKQTKS